MSIEHEADRYKVEYRTEGDRHCRPGWIQFDCPYCGPTTGKRWHLGFNEESRTFNCWSCGKHPPKPTIQRLFRLSPEEAGTVWGRVRSHEQTAIRTKQTDIPPPARSSLSWPYGCRDIEADSGGFRYLRSRGFASPTALARMWGLRETGIHGPYNFRIIAPIYHDGRMVSFQGRDYTGRSPLRYKACAASHELRPHKSCLYGAELLGSQEEAMVVEGIVDAWKMGRGTVATFGTAFTLAQVAELAEFERVGILYDPEDEEGAEAGGRLAQELAMIGVRATSFRPEGITDPGDMEEDEAHRLREQLMARLRPKGRYGL